MKKKISFQELAIIKQLFISSPAYLELEDNSDLFDMAENQFSEELDDSYSKKCLVVTGDDLSEEKCKDYDIVFHFGTSSKEIHTYKTEFRYMLRGQSMRWVYPKGEYKSVLDFCPDSNLRQQTTKTILRLISLCKLDRLVSDVVTIHSKEKLKLVHAQDGTPFDSYSIFLGTEGPERTVLVSLLNRGKCTSFLKFGLNSYSQNKISTEGNALYRLSHCNLKTIKIPAIRSNSRNEVISISKVGVKGRSSGTQFTRMHANAIIELFNLSKKSKRFDQTQFAGAIIYSLQFLRLKKTKNLEPIISLLERNLEGVDYDSYFFSSYTHGDFTPWNMFVEEEKIHLYDWENFKDTAPFLFDLFHFHFQTGTHLKKWSFERTYENIKTAIEENDNLQHAVVTNSIDVKEYLRLYLLYIVSEKLALQIATRRKLNSIELGQLAVWVAALKETLPAVENQRALMIDSLNDFLVDIPHAFVKFDAPSLKELPIGSDLDIAVHRSEVDAVAIFCQGHELVKRCKLTRKSFMYTLQLFLKDDGFLSIDLIYDFKRKSKRFMNIDHLLDSAYRSKKGIMVPDLRFDFEYVLFFYYLNGAQIPDKYYELYMALSPKEMYRIYYYLKVKYALDANCLGDILHSVDPVRLQLQKSLNGNHLATFSEKIKLKLNYISDTIKEYVWRKGFIITISGVDGIGKTSVIKGLKDQIQTKYRKEVVLLRHRPRILPILSSIKYGSIEKAEKRTSEGNPGRVESRGTISSAIRFIYYYTDYLLGQVYINFKYVHRGKIVLYDRYYFDMINNPERMNLKINRRFAKMMYSLIQKPALNVLLHAPSEEIFKRKQELDKRTIERLNVGYLRLFREFSKKYNRSKYVIEQNDNLKSTIAAILSNVQQVA